MLKPTDKYVKKLKIQINALLIQKVELFNTKNELISHTPITSESVVDDTGITTTLSVDNFINKIKLTRIGEIEEMNLKITAYDKSDKEIFEKTITHWKMNEGTKTITL